MIERAAEQMNVSLDEIAIEDPSTSPRREEYALFLWQRRQRKGLSLEEARRQLYNGNYFGSCMVARGDADALVSGVNLHYPETIRPALQVIGAHAKAGVVSGMHMLVFEKHVIFCGDTTVNIDPTAEQLAQIAYAASRITRTLGVVPRIAMLSFSNFGSVRHADAEKMARAAQLLRERDPSLMVDGEMQADTAFNLQILERDYPFSTLKDTANVLIFPNLSASNIAYKLLNHLGGATAIGPILVGMRRPVHVLERGAEVQDIVNMAAVAVVDAQNFTRPANGEPPRRTARPRQSSRGYRTDGHTDDAAAKRHVVCVISVCLSRRLSGTVRREIPQPARPRPQQYVRCPGRRASAPVHRCGGIDQ